MSLRWPQTKDFLTQDEMAAIGSLVAESAKLEDVLEGFIIQMTSLAKPNTTS